MGSLTWRRVGGIALALPLVAALSACGGRSQEAYCAVISDHKTEYESAMSGAMANENPLAGLGTAVGAVDGLGDMWQDAAAAAPSDIQGQVEVVRDTWNGDLFDTDDDDGDWLSGVADGFTAVQASFEAHRDVDIYTAENCPGVGGMFTADPAGTQQAGADSEPNHDDETATVSDASESEPAAPESPEPEEIDLSVLDYAQYEWSVFGPYLVNQESRSNRVVSVEGPVTVALPGTEPVTVDASELLAGDEVLHQQYTYGTDDQDEPVLIGVVEVRTPASGLTPEGEHLEVLVIDTSGAPEIISRNDVQEGITASEELSTSGTGHITLRSEPERQEEATVYGIEAATGDVIWSEDGTLSSASSGSASVFTPASDDGFQRSCEGTHTVRDIATGDIGATVETRASEEADAACGTPLDERFWSFRVHEFPYDEESGYFVDRFTHHVHDAETGQAVEIATRAWLGESLADNLAKDPSRPLGYPENYIGDEFEDMEDLAVFDLTTGEAVYSLDASHAAVLNLEAESLFDGKLYVTTSDEQLVIDVDTGEDIGTWEVYPVAQWSTTEGDYAWMSDGSLHLEWEYDPADVLPASEGDSW